jgi:hypothetical protein
MEAKTSGDTSVLLIGAIQTPSALRLRSEAALMGITLDCLAPQQLRLYEGGVIIEEGSNLSRNFLDYDTYFFRGMDDQADRMQLVAKSLVANGKRVVERCFAEVGMPEDKHVTDSKLGHYRLPETMFLNFPVSHEVVPNFKFPCVAKKIGAGSSKG